MLPATKEKNMHEIKLKEKTYYYDSTWRALYEDKEQKTVVRPRYLSQEDYREYIRQVNIINDILEASKHNSD
jgi:hypothetical protein